MGDQGMHGADVEQRAQTQRHVRGVPHLVNGGGHDQWQPHAAMGGIDGDTVPAALGIGPIGFDKTRGRANDTVLQMAAHLIADVVQGGPNLFGQFRRLGEDLAGQLRRGVLKAGQPGDGGGLA